MSSIPVPPITCHILDTTRGKPASEVLCEISYTEGDRQIKFATARTNKDGRVSQWIPLENANSGTESLISKIMGVSTNDITKKYWTDVVSGEYKIRFYTETYFQQVAKSEGYKGESFDKLAASFFPFVDINFIVPKVPDAHYHVPLLLSNYGYSTYRGS